MAPQPPGTFKFDLQSITQHASPASGVYALFSPSECVYVGESDDVCASLLQTFFQDSPSLHGRDVTHFTVELVSPESRVARQIDRIRELVPVCNGGMGSPECGHMRSPLGQSGRKAVPLAKHHEARVEKKTADLSSSHLPPAPRPELPGGGKAKVLPAREKERATRETNVRGVPKDAQSKAVLRDVMGGRGRSTEGQIAQLRPTPQAVSGLTERILVKMAAEKAGRRLAAPRRLHPALRVHVKQSDRTVATTVGGWLHWRLATISGLLIVIAVASFWASFP